MEKYVKCFSTQQIQFRSYCKITIHEMDQLQLSICDLDKLINYISLFLQLKLAFVFKKHIPQLFNISNILLMSNYYFLMLLLIELCNQIKIIMGKYDDQEEALSGKVPISVEHRSRSLGKMKAIYDSDYCHLSVGPDYICFLVSFLVLILQSILTTLFVYSNSLNTNMRLATIMIQLFTPLCFLYASLSDPGIYDPANNLQTKTKYCNRCRTFIPKNCHHCLRCDVCIEGYDHHCVWLSKCVGENNIISFYLVIVSIPLTFVYSIVAIIATIPTQII